jgi:hypothetical protein
MRLLAFVVAAFVLASGPASAQTGKDAILTIWGLEDMTAAVGAAGGKVQSAGKLSGTEDLILIVDISGFRFAIAGNLCSGVPIRCGEARLYADHAYGTLTADQMMAVIGFGAGILVAPVNPTRMRTTRYIYVNRGYTLAAITLEIQQTAAAFKAANAKIVQAGTKQ